MRWFAVGALTLFVLVPVLSGCPGDCIPPPVPAPFMCGEPTFEPPDETERFLATRSDWRLVRGLESLGGLCGLAEDGSLHCEDGASWDGPFLDFFGTDGMVALRADGSLVALADPDASLPEGMFRAIAGTVGEGCAAHDYGVTCWDAGRFYEHPDLVTAAVVGSSVCGLDVEERVLCRRLSGMPHPELAEAAPEAGPTNLVGVDDRLVCGTQNGSALCWAAGGEVFRTTEGREGGTILTAYAGTVCLAWREGGGECSSAGRGLFQVHEGFDGDPIDAVGLATGVVVVRRTGEAEFDVSRGFVR